jgi:hypothetical protein
MGGLHSKGPYILRHSPDDTVVARNTAPSKNFDVIDE